MLVYMLHFDEPIGRSRHYIGSTRDGRLMLRMGEHAAGRGAALTREACRRGVGWRIVRTWTVADRQGERDIKRRRRTAAICPLCEAGLTAAAFASTFPHVEPAPRTPCAFGLDFPERPAASRPGGPAGRSTTHGGTMFGNAMLLLNLLSVAPHFAEDIAPAIEALKSDKNGIDKLKAALQALEDIINDVQKALGE